MNENGFVPELPLNAAAQQLASAWIEEADQARRLLREQAQREADAILADAQRIRDAARAEVARLQAEAAELLEKLRAVGGPPAGPPHRVPDQDPAAAPSDAEQARLDARREADRILAAARAEATARLEEASRTATAILGRAERAEPVERARPVGPDRRAEDARAPAAAAGAGGSEPHGDGGAASVVSSPTDLNGHHTFSSGFVPVAPLDAGGSAWPTRATVSPPDSPTGYIPLLGSRGRHLPSAREGEDRPGPEPAATRPARPAAVSGAGPDPALAVPPDPPERRPWAGRRRRVL